MKTNKTIAAGEFKAKCLKIMEQVQQTHQSIVITKRGIPIAKLVPIDEVATPKLFGALEGSVTIVGDIIAPTDESWSVDEK